MSMIFMRCSYSRDSSEPPGRCLLRLSLLAVLLFLRGLFFLVIELRKVLDVPELARRDGPDVVPHDDAIGHRAVGTDLGLDDEQARRILLRVALQRGHGGQ